MNAKAIIPLVAGLGIAGLAAKLGIDFIKKAEGNQTKVVQLWTPVQDIKRGVAINKAMLQPLTFPANVVPSGAMSDVDKIVGRVPHTGAPAGVPVLNSMLLPPGVRAGVQVPPGFRAVAVKINESSGVDNHLEPGCRVDVVGVFTVRTGNRSETLARTILEDVEVAAVGERLAPSTPGPAGEKGGKSGKRERPAQAVTLLVKPEDVPSLHLAEQKGKIKLSMRGVLDESRSPRHARVIEDDLFGLERPKPDGSEPSWDDKLDDLMSTLAANTSAPPPATPDQPGYAWVMTVYNGAERQRLAWAHLDDHQAVELGVEGPNIFQDEPKLPPTESEFPGEGTGEEESPVIGT